MEIIDAHSHLGNNHYPNGGDLIEKKGIKSKKFDAFTMSELSLYNKWFFNDLNGKIFSLLAEKSTLGRMAACTRENMRKSMDEAGVSRTV